VDQRVAKHSFASKDARLWARWGVDYLKYDWHPNDKVETARMAKALRASGRDVVLSLSNTLPFEDAEITTSLANCWRTTGDIVDMWDRKKTTRGSYLGVMDIWRHHNNWGRFQRPGHFNDADMLVLGAVGWGKPKPTRLTREQQRTHFSLWVMFGSPLLLGCDLSRLDPFTRSLLTNDEVLDVHQDELAKQAGFVYDLGDREAWTKPLADGGLALGLFNPHVARTEKVGVSLKELGLKPGQAVRDLWSGKELGRAKAEIKLSVPGYGVRLLKVGGRR
jgi:alpha-galactosidase